ncbi:MAG TPA: hypothetical protein DDZ91_11970 [Firmicutes bacterium]|jgi:hypothetical protein|nr:hypothetical protein [Bacillota bacterium]
MEEYNNPSKVYVDVLAVFNQEGELRPLALKWEDGRRYPVDRVIDVRQAASLKAGGTGIRYTCKIRGKQTYLFFEEGRWWVERR